MKWRLSMVIVFMLALMPLAALAQDGEEMAEYSPEDGLFSASYPAEWVATPGGDTLPFPSVWFSPAAETAEAFTTDGTLAAGDVIALAFIAPTSLLEAFGFGIPADAPVTAWAGLFAMLLSEPPTGGPPPGAEEEGAPAEETATEEAATEEAATEEAPVEGEEMGMPPLPEGEEVTIGEDVTAGFIEQSTPIYDQVIYVTQLADDLLGVTTVVAPPGELSGDYKALAEQIALSVASSYTGAELLQAQVQAMLLPDAEGVTADQLDGAALAQERCTVCHPADWWDAQDKTPEEWASTVDRMILHGAQLTAAEREAIINYLAETH